MAAPVAITCTGPALDPLSGRPLNGRALTFGLEFDQAAQAMTLTEGGTNGPEPLKAVRVTDSMASGSTGKWIFEVNRIDGTATNRLDLAADPKARELGMTGNFFRGTCAEKGRGKF